MSSFKNIISNIFGTRESQLKSQSEELICKAADLAIDKVNILKSSKEELIKAFDEFNETHIIEIEKAEENVDKQSIQRRLDRYELSFLSDIKNVTSQLSKAIDDQNKDVSIALKVIDDSHENFEKYNSLLGNKIEKSINYFENINFDTNVDKLSFDETCKLLSKAIENGILEKSDRPFVIEENEFHASLLTLAKAKEEGNISEDVIEKGSRRLSDLTPVRRQVVSANGTVFMKTVYVKKEEKAPEKAITYLNQKDAEKNLQPGDKVNVNFKGWSSGRPYTVEKMEVKSVTPNYITVKFTEDFNTGSYTYGPNSSDARGREVKIPTTKNEKWNQKERLELWVDPEVERNRQRMLAKKEAGREERDLARAMKTHTGGSGDGQTNATQEINHSDNLVTGDSVQFEKRGELIKGRIQSMWRQGDGKARLEIKKLDGTTTFKTIGPETRNGSVQKIIEGDSVGSSDDGNLIVKDPSTMNLEMIRELGKNGVKFGNNTITETKNLYSGEGGQDMFDSSAARTWCDGFNRNFPNFNAAEMLGDIRKELKDEGVQRINMTLTPRGTTGSFDINITGSGGFKMIRNFTVEPGGETKVYNNWFETGRDNQGKGLGKKLFRLYNKQYRRCGLDRMDVSAGLSTGGYTWCRFGFTADKNTAKNKVAAFKNAVGNTRRFKNSRGEMIDHTMTQAEANQAETVFKKFYENNPSSTRFPMNALAAIGDTLAGRHILLGSGWSGRIDLNDIKQRDTFETYIKYN